jgi:signal transduction histidine kinase
MITKEQKTILLVEDEVIIAMTDSEKLKEYGYNVIHALTGQKAIEAINNNKTSIDLILMDINLGEEKDGAEIAKIILKDHDIPILFHSNHTESEVVKRTNDITSYGYVVKNGITVLDASIKMALRLHDAEEKTKQSLEVIKKLNSEKDKFFSIIAHDLRSPFIGFLNLTELMADDTEEFSPAEFRENNKSLNGAARKFYRLLNNLLEWAQIENGSINFNPKDSNLSEIVSQSIETISLRAIEKEIEIVNEVVGQKVYADEKMIGSIFSNLLSNAVKFSNKGGRVIIKSKRLDDGTIQVSVDDNGVGIPVTDIKRLFKIEERVSNKGTDNEPSTGLGLLLCKEFTEMHGGKIWAESEEKKGSVFYFTLPVKNGYETKPLNGNG